MSTRGVNGELNPHSNGWQELLSPSKDPGGKSAKLMTPRTLVRYRTDADEYDNEMNIAFRSGGSNERSSTSKIQMDGQYRDDVLRYEIYQKNGSYWVSPSPCKQTPRQDSDRPYIPMFRLDFDTPDSQRSTPEMTNVLWEKMTTKWLPEAIEQAREMSGRQSIDEGGDTQGSPSQVKPDSPKKIPLPQTPIINTEFGRLWVVSNTPSDPGSPLIQSPSLKEQQHSPRGAGDSPLSQGSPNLKSRRVSSVTLTPPKLSSESNESGAGGSVSAAASRVAEPVVAKSRFSGFCSRLVLSTTVAALTAFYLYSKELSRALCQEPQPSSWGSWLLEDADNNQFLFCQSRV